jgi:hypothetical protein
MPGAPEPAFCSAEAREHGAQLHGSATEARAWLCIEIAAPWAAREIRDGSLPTAVKRQIQAWEEEVPGLRTQAIRREVGEPDVEGEVTVFVARASLHEPDLWRLRLPSHEALLEVDVPGLLRTGSTPGAERVERSLVLTCTNGKRDRCCAKYGRELHAALRNAAGGAAWQTTHLGGHRFAPTCLVLPLGLQYGWLDPGEAGRFWGAVAGGRLFDLDRYRGHVAFPRPAQAAAIQARRDYDLLGVGDVRLLEVTSESEAWTVRLSAPHGEQVYRVTKEPGPVLVKSCAQAAKPTSTYAATQVDA